MWAGWWVARVWLAVKPGELARTAWQLLAVGSIAPSACGLCMGACSLGEREKKK